MPCSGLEGAAGHQQTETHTPGTVQRAPRQQAVGGTAPRSPGAHGAQGERIGATQAAGRGAHSLVDRHHREDEALVQPAALDAIKIGLSQVPVLSHRRRCRGWDDDAPQSHKHASRVQTNTRRPQKPHTTKPRPATRLELSWPLHPRGARLPKTGAYCLYNR